jgi:poly-gamma-glutamate synthesis protein (capsule biosynthesis protein)
VSGTPIKNATESPPAPANTGLTNTALTNTAGAAQPALGGDTSIVAPTTTVVATTVPGPPAITMAFSGDILIHSQLWQKATEYNGGTGYDFTPMFARVKPLLDSVDFAICHLEVPLAPPGKQPSTFPLYGAPKELVAAIAKAGYDHCSTASNHSLDQGNAGIDATVNEFDANGITESGMARVQTEIGPKVFKVNGIKFTHLSYTFGFNGLSLPADQPWRSALIDPARIIADATKARSMGAQLVVVSMHWGNETVTAVTDYQRKAAKTITASGVVDLVIGHHAHVVQQIEQVNGIWTVFGLGNVLSYHPTRQAFPPNSQDGMIVTVKLSLDTAGKAAVEKPIVYPTWVDKQDGIVIRPVLSDLADPSVSAATKSQLNISLTRTAGVVGDYIAQK